MGDIFTYDIVQFKSNITVETMVIEADNLEDADAEAKKNPIPEDCTVFLSGIRIAS
jgi:hypothetical protein